MAFSRREDMGTWRAGTVFTGYSHARPGKGGPVGSRKQTGQRSLPCPGVTACRQLSGAWPKWPDAEAWSCHGWWPSREQGPDLATAPGLGGRLSVCAEARVLHFLLSLQERQSRNKQ